MADAQEKRSKELKMNTDKYTKMTTFSQTVSTMLSSVRNYGNKHTKDEK